MGAERKDSTMTDTERTRVMAFMAMLCALFMLAAML